MDKSTPAGDAGPGGLSNRHSLWCKGAAPPGTAPGRGRPRQRGQPGDAHDATARDGGAATRAAACRPAIDPKTMAGPMVMPGPG